LYYNIWDWYNNVRCNVQTLISACHVHSGIRPWADTPCAPGPQTILRGDGPLGVWHSLYFPGGPQPMLQGGLRSTHVEGRRLVDGYMGDERPHGAGFEAFGGRAVPSGERCHVRCCRVQVQRVRGTEAGALVRGRWPQAANQGHLGAAGWHWSWVRPSSPTPESAAPSHRHDATSTTSCGWPAEGNWGSWAIRAVSRGACMPEGYLLRVLPSLSDWWHAASAGSPTVSIDGQSGWASRTSTSRYRWTSSARACCCCSCEWPRCRRCCSRRR